MINAKPRDGPKSHRLLMSLISIYKKKEVIFMNVLKNPPYYMNIFFRQEYGEYTGGYGIVEAGKQIVYPIMDFTNCVKIHSGYGGIIKLAAERMYAPVYSDIRYARYSRFSDMVNAHPELSDRNVKRAIRCRFKQLGIRMLTRKEEKNIKQVVEYDPSAGKKISKIRDNIEKYFEKLPQLACKHICDNEIDLWMKLSENAN